jgi:hypothetical protein
MSLLSSPLSILVYPVSLFYFIPYLIFSFFLLRFFPHSGLAVLLSSRYLKIVDDTRDSRGLSSDFRGTLFGRTTLDYAIERNNATIGIDIDRGQGLHTAFGSKVSLDRRRNTGVVHVRSRAFSCDFSAPRE